MGEGIPAQSGSSDIEKSINEIDRIFGAGLQALGDVTRSDGALQARDKALLLIAATAVRDRANTCSEVEQAIGLGVEATEIEALALALYLSRGRGPCAAVLTCLPPRRAPENVVVEPVDIPSVASMVEGFRQIFGEVPDRIALLAEMSPSGLAAYHLMRGAVLDAGGLEPLIAELALVTVNASEHRSDFAAVHVVGARRAGATEEQLVEAGICAIPSGGVAAWLAATEAIIATRTGQPCAPNTSNDLPNQR